MNDEMRPKIVTLPDGRRYMPASELWKVPKHDPYAKGFKRVCPYDEALDGFIQPPLPSRVDYPADCEPK